MRTALTLTIAVLLLTGCAARPDGISQLGCSNVADLLPQIDAVHNGEPATQELSDEITASLEGDLFDNETFSLFRLLGEEVRDQFDSGYTVNDELDHDDIRARLVAHCKSVGWPLDDESLGAR
jgi:hypothetical protein